MSDTPADLVPVVICRYLIEYQTGRCSHNGSVLPQPPGFSGARSRSEGAPPHQTAIAAVSAQLTSADRCYGMQNTCCCRPWRILTGGVLPTDLLFTATDFNSYVTVSTAEGAPKRRDGRMSAPTGAGLGVDPQTEILGDPVFEIGR